MAARDPLLNAASWGRAKEAFGLLRGLPPGRARRRAVRACGGDARLARAVLRLLERGGGARGFLDAPERPVPPAAGTLLAGRYRLGRRLGEGGSGLVLAARDLMEDRPVAVKLLRGGPLSDPREARREAAALRWLRIPGVVRLLDDGVDGDSAFLVLERLRGRPFPGRPCPRPWKEIRETVIALAETVERIHGLGLVHGDLKPGNVLVDGRGIPVVLDLGISGGPAHARSPRQGLRGTPGFAAPEILLGKPPDPRSDLFALGALLRRAFRLPAPPGDPGPTAPRGLRSLLRDLAAPEPRDRPADAGEVLHRLGRGEDQLPSLPRRVRGARDLHPLFAGEDRLLHLREDGAAELHRRTAGRPAALRRELGSWRRSGLASIRDGRVDIDRDGLERLRSGDALGRALLRESTARVLVEARRARARLEGDGRPEAALAAVEAGLAEATRAGRTREEERFLEDVLRLALASGRAPVIDRALGLAQRASPGADPGARIENLLRAARAAVAGRGAEALAAARSLPSRLPPVPAMARWSIRVFAARQLPLAEEEREVRAALRWAAAAGRRAHPGIAEEWRGWVRYRRGEFDRAAAAHLVAAGRSADPARRISRLLNAATAALDGFDFGEARRRAREAEALAARIRHPGHEARAACLLREADYRSGRAREPDRELMRAIRLVGVPHLEALVHLNEAAVAWRAGRRGFARRTALRAAAVWRGRGNAWLRLLAEALAAAAAGRRGGAPLPTAGDLAGCPLPGIALQVAGLLAPLAGAARLRRWAALAPRLAASLPAAKDGLRREVLSIDECLERLGLPTRSPRRGSAAAPQSPGNGRKGGR